MILYIIVYKRSMSDLKCIGFYFLFFFFNADIPDKYSTY